ncbi:MAG: murein biosynthesis integral membrane protein MurJ [Rickettsiales bacterium]|jgi:putative peptidoglycan lipid II flippase|nr:murein biosynthesis integral membrane protein MurJ [Rickettsiales bacterium]
MSKFIKSVFATSIGTLISKISGYVRDIFIAKYLGNGLYSDIFFIAFKLPNLFRKITAEGALSSAFIPIFANGVNSYGKKKMLHFARNIFSILLYFLIIVTVFFEIFMPQVMSLFAIGYHDEKLKSVILLSRITFPYLIFISIIALASGILNTFNKFFITSIGPVFLNASIVLFIYFSRNLLSENIMLFMSFGVVFSGILQLIFIGFFLIRDGFYLFPIIPKLTKRTREFFDRFFGVFIASGIVQINSFISSIIATFVQGGVSLLYYGDRIAQFPLSLIGTAIGVSILPYLSKVINTDKEESQMLQESSFFLSIFFGLPSSVFLFTLAEQIVCVLFERGKFTVFDTINVANIVRIYSIAIPFFIFTKILNAIFYAKKDTKTPMYASLINLAINVVFSIFFLNMFGVNGIAIASVISNLVSTVIMFIKIIKEKIFIITEEFKIKFLKTLYLSITMGIIIVCIRIWMTNLGTNDFLNLIFSGGIGGFVFLLLSQGFGVINIWELINLFHVK